MSKKTQRSSVILFDIEMAHGRHYDLHEHNYHEFFLTLEGRGEQFSDFGAMKMRKGDLFLFPSGQAHHGRSAANAYCLGGVIYLYENQFYSGCRERESRQVLRAMIKCAEEGQSKFNLDPDGRKLTVNLFKEMLEEEKQKKPGYRCIVETMMEQLLITILRYCRSPLAIKLATDNPVAVQKIQDILRFLESHYMQVLDISQVAQMVNMSRSYFHLMFKNVTGKTFVAYLNGLRVKEAERQLREDVTTSTEKVARRCGFTSVSHFYKVLKELTGNSPKSLRRQRQKP